MKVFVNLCPVFSELLTWSLHCLSHDHLISSLAHTRKGISNLKNLKPSNEGILQFLTAFEGFKYFRLLIPFLKSQHDYHSMLWLGERKPNGQDLRLLDFGRNDIFMIIKFRLKNFNFDQKYIQKQVLKTKIFICYTIKILVKYQKKINQKSM